MSPRLIASGSNTWEDDPWARGACVFFDLSFSAFGAPLARAAVETRVLCRRAHEQNLQDYSDFSAADLKRNFLSLGVKREKTTLRTATFAHFFLWLGREQDRLASSVDGRRNSLTA